MICNSEEERNQRGAEFKTEEDFYKEILESKGKNIVLLELLEKSEEYEGNLKERMRELEEKI